MLFGSLICERVPQSRMLGCQFLTSARSIVWLVPSVKSAQRRLRFGPKALRVTGAARRARPRRTSRPGRSRNWSGRRSPNVAVVLAVRADLARAEERADRLGGRGQVAGIAVAGIQVERVVDAALLDVGQDAGEDAEIARPERARPVATTTIAEGGRPPQVCS